MDLRDAATVVVAVGFLVLGASGVLTLAWPAFRRGLLERLLGSAWYSITAKTRAEDRRQARRTRLRQAIGVLAEGLAMGLHNAEAQVKIAQAIAEFRTEGSPDLKLLIDAVASVTAGHFEAAGSYRFSQVEIDALVDPITQRLRAELGEA